MTKIFLHTRISRLMTNSSPVPDIRDLTLFVSVSGLLSLNQVRLGFGLAVHLHSIRRFLPAPSWVTLGFSLKTGGLPPVFPAWAPESNIKAYIKHCSNP